MIRILLLIIVIVLFIAAFYLNKHNESLTNLFARGTRTTNVQAILKQFYWIYLFLGLSGLLLSFFNHLIYSLFYIAVVLIASAAFSLLLAKNMND